MLTLVDDDSVCPITLEPLACLHYPVVFQSDLRFVFELDALLEWLRKSRTHPITRQTVVIQHDFIVPVPWCDSNISRMKVCNFVQSSRREKRIKDAMFIVYVFWGWISLCGVNNESMDVGIGIALNLINFIVGCGCCMFTYKNGNLLVIILSGSYCIVVWTSAVVGGWFDIDQIVRIWSLTLLATVTLISTVRYCCGVFRDF